MNEAGLTQNQAGLAIAALLDQLVPRGITSDTKIRSGKGRGGRLLQPEPVTPVTDLDKGRSSKMKEVTAYGLNFYPSSWLESLGDHKVHLVQRGDALNTGTGGSHIDLAQGGPSHSGSLISVPLDIEGAPDTIVHEFGHMMETNVPGLKKWIVAHLDSRIDPEEQAAALGMGARGYADEIRDNYAKRVYVGLTGDNASGPWREVRDRVEATEYLTTGAEAFVPGASRGGDVRYFGQDMYRDAFVLGTMVLFNPTLVVDPAGVGETVDLGAAAVPAGSAP